MERAHRLIALPGDSGVHFLRVSLFMRHVVLAVGLSFTVAACGGGETGPAPKLDHEQALRQAQDFTAANRAGNVTFLRSDQAPSGQVDLRGLFLSHGSATKDTLIGTMDMSVDFSTSQISGSVTDMGWYGADRPLVRNEQVDGQLGVNGRVTSGADLRSNVTIAGDVQSRGNAKYKPHSAKLTYSNMQGSFARKSGDLYAIGTTADGVAVVTQQGESKSTTYRMEAAYVVSDNAP